MRSPSLLALALAACAANSGTAPPPPPPPPPFDSARAAALLDTLEERTFNYFWTLTNPQNCLTPDRAPSPSFSSIAAVGFALTAYPIGLERGYVTRARCMGCLSRRLPEGLMVRPAARRLRPAVRAPVLPRVDGFSRHPGRVHE